MGSMIQVRLHHKVIVWLLTLCLTITLIPDIGYAVESNSTGNKEVKEPVDRVTEEDVIERSESVTTYDMGNGEKMSVFHGGDVRFKNGSGEWEDYDPSLVRIKAGERTGNNQTLEGYKYRNKTGDKKHYFPESLSESTPVIMENGEYRIEITPTDETVETASLTDTQAYVQKETVPSVYEGEEQLPVNAVYENKIGRLGIRYTSGEHGIKETILLNRKPDSGIFEYTINIGKLDIKKNVTDEGLTIYDKKTDEIVACIDAPWMNDADGDSYSQDISYDLEKDEHTEGQYKLTMNVDEDYLFDSDRKYPVTIDPTTTWKGDDELRDVYVISGSYAGTNFYESGTKVMPSGRNNTGTHRTYIKPLNLKSKISGKSVSSAKLTVYETGNGVSKQKIKAYRVLENWSSTSLTWNNKPKNASDPTAQITTTKTAKSAKTFDMTGFARKIAGGTSNYGVVLKNMTSNSSYAEFHGSRATLTSCRPKLSVTYHDVPTTPESFSLSRKSGESYTSSSYHKKGRTIYASWTGISSYSLAQVQYKIIAGDNNTAEPSSVGTNNVDLTKYRSIGLASDSAVNKGVSYTSSLPAGVYKIYLRGKDDAGNYGTAKSKTFYIDGTAPVLTDVKTVPQTSASSYTKNLMPTVSWNTEDTYFSKVTVSIDGDEEVSATTTSGTGSYAVPSGKITSSGKHTIKVTAYDKSGNTKSSTLEYYVDKDEPEGSISLSSPGYDAENSDLSGTVNVAVTMQGTGSPLKTVTLKMYKLTDTGTESTLSANLIADYLNDENKENDSSNTDLDTTKLDNGRYRFKLHMEDKAGNTSTLTKDVTVLNRLAAPGISLSDTTNGTVSVHWSFDDEVRLECIQYRIGNDGTWQNGQIVSNGSSEGEFDITLPSENKYRIYFRGKAKDGTVGESTSRNVVYDKTAPHIRIVDFVHGYLKGTISDTSRLTWRMYIKEKTQADSAYVEICSGTENIENGNIGFVNLGAEIYASGREYVIKVTAVDALGNQSSETYEVYKTSDGKSAELIDAGFRVKRPAYQGYDSGKIVFPSDMTKMSLKKANEQSWPQGLTRWYVDNQLVSSNEIYEDDFSTTGHGNESAGYDENVEYDIFVIHKQDSGEIWYSNDVIKNGDVQELELSEDAISNGNINKTISVSGKKVVSLRITESQQVPQKEGVTYQIKIDESEYIDVEPDENFIIADKIQDKAYAESVMLRVRAGSNTSVNDISVAMDIIAPESSEVFTLSEAENYRPHNLSVADKINYKTYIMWENEITDDTPENIYYEIYRGTEPDFVPGPDNLAATNIRAGYYSEINVNYRGNFYYRVRAVKENDGIKSGSGYSEQVYSRVVDGNEYIKRMGVKDYWEFAEIETPIGDLNIEKSMGNMVYSQKDADIPNEQLEVALNRTYNSQATSKVGVWCRMES